MWWKTGNKAGGESDYEKSQQTERHWIAFGLFYNLLPLCLQASCCASVQDSGGTVRTVHCKGSQ